MTGESPAMARCALFAGCDYYPEGGMEDLKLVGSLEECKAEGNTWARAYSPWAHIADLQTMKVIFTATWTPTVGEMVWVAA